MMDSPAKSNDEAASQKKAYRKPSLTRYGQLKELTTGGSGANMESSKGQEKGKHP